MNSRLALAATFILSCGLCACEKALPDFATAGEHAAELTTTKNASIGEYLVDYDMVSYDFGDECKDYFAGLVSSWLDRDLFDKVYSILFEGRVQALQSQMEKEGAERTGRVEVYTIRYNSLSTKGEPIVLSACVVLPNFESENGRSHTLNDITLYTDYWKSYDEYVTLDGCPEFIRSLYNQAVVISDYEGYGVTQSEVHPFSSFMELGQQCIDCELAAFELLSEIGAGLKKDAGTYVMGMSKGAPVSMAVSKLLKTSCSEKTSSKINLKSTYCCSGPYDLSAISESYRTIGQTDENNWIFPFMAIGAYYTDPAFKEDGFGLGDFFCDKFNETAATDSRILQQLLTKEAYQSRLNSAYNEHGFKCIQDVVNPRFFKEDGTFNREDALAGPFFSYLERENPATGWTPTRPVLIEYSKDDTFCPYETTHNSYLELRSSDTISGIPNFNVVEHVYSGINHETMTTIGIVRTILLENPVKGILSNIIDGFDTYSYVGEDF